MHIPDGVSDAEARTTLLAEFNLEIGGGLGPTKGQVWRIGLLGESAKRANVFLGLSALESLLVRQVVRCAPGAGVATAPRPSPPARRLLPSCLLPQAPVTNVAQAEMLRRTFLRAADRAVEGRRCGSWTITSGLFPFALLAILCYL